ncbi:hypothetical protein HMPREF3185_02244 [Porphyromonas somerae]|uniref:Uncharacterized protein n=1 Tax=Porphyromonas somerae TaxID=322095 RepID=A0A134AYG9_9PORP|nr:hypothetical protein HMPREF3184_02244 [Porphyromonadaceae bacterium KA00676]KXB72716.1 hypothetical protein HMPREF3185_02244 [Porphyromonas somerae]
MEYSCSDNRGGACSLCFDWGFMLHARVVLITPRRGAYKEKRK